MAPDPIRDAVRSGRTVFNAWTMLGSSLAIEYVASAGWDAITVDQQHGIGGNAELVACLTAAKAAGKPALVRVACNDEGLIGRALDAGAQGVICPMVNSADDAARLVQASKYPPLGARSFGPYRARLVSETPYFDWANDWIIACAQIETRAALDAIDAILATDGLDMIYLGPNDLSVSLLDGERLDIRAPEVAEALDLVLRKAREHKVIAGVFANDMAFARPLIDAGWDVVSIGSDGGWLADGAAAALPGA